MAGPAGDRVSSQVLCKLIARHKTSGIVLFRNPNWLMVLQNPLSVTEIFTETQIQLQPLWSPHRVLPFVKIPAIFAGPTMCQAHAKCWAFLLSRLLTVDPSWERWALFFPLTDEEPRSSVVKSLDEVLPAAKGLSQDSNPGQLPQALSAHLQSEEMSR